MNARFPLSLLIQRAELHDALIVHDWDSRISPLRSSRPHLGRALAVLLFLGAVAMQAEWVLQPTPATNSSLRSVQAVNAKVVWAGGTGGTCLRTLDGGATWEKLIVPSAERLDFRGVAAFDTQTAIVMGAGEAERGLARMFRTSDGGQHWQLVFQTDEKGAFLDCVSFWDERAGLALGDPIDGKGYLLRTADGGRTWERIPPGQLPVMLPNEATFAAGNSAMVMQGASNVWIATGGAERARVFRSIDRGQTWRVAETPMPAGPTAGIFGLQFLDAQRAVGVGGDHQRVRAASDNVIVTSDGGRTWRKVAPTDPPGLKEAAVALGGDVLVAVGPSGTSLSRDFGSSWQKIDLAPFHAACCAEGQCWAVGGRGMVAKWK